MQLTETQEKLLRDVLDQLMNSYTVSSEELSATHAYLFGQQALPPIFTDKELFDTVLYLREVVGANGVLDINGLVQYYKTRKKGMRDFLTALVAEDSAAPDLRSQDNRTVNEVHVADSYVISSLEANHLVKQVGSEIQRVFENVCSNMAKFLQSSPLPTAGENDIHAVVKKHVTDLIKRYNPGTLHCSLSIAMQLPFGITHYLKQFASPYKGEQIFFLQFRFSSEVNMQMVAEGYSDLLAFGCFSAIWSRLLGNQPPDYDSIITVIKKGKPIFGAEFKIELTKWLVYSKLMSYRYECKQPQLRASTDISFNRLFYKTPVRLYSGSFMQKWIVNLFETKLSRKRWVILKRPPGHFWLTSDNPGFSLNINGMAQVTPRHSLLDIRPDSVLYYPLSKDYCLKLEPSVSAADEENNNLPIDYALPSEGEVDFVNGVTVSTQKQLVIANQKKTLKQIQL
jgi:hypothetical protein